MKSKADIQRRLRSLVVAEFERRLEQAQRRLPRLCVHNYRHPLDVRRTIDGEPNEGYNRITSGSNGRSLPVLQTIGLCTVNSDNPEEWGGTICEDDVDAQRCPLFNPVMTKERLLSEFREELGSQEWLMENMPEAATLMWALGEVQAPSLPWWKRLWFRLRRLSVEPVQAAPSLDELLSKLPGP